VLDPVSVVQRCKIVVLAVLLAAAPAAARPKAVDPATAAYKQGQRLFDLREWDAAIAKFKEAYKLRADAPSLFSIAQAFQNKGDCVEALGFYETYRRTFPKQKNIGKVEGLINELEPCAKAAKDQAAKDQAAQDQAAQVAKDPPVNDPPATAQALAAKDALATAPAVKAPAISLPASEPPSPPTSGPKEAPPSIEPAPWAKLLSGGKISFYGMLRIDTHYTDNAMNDPRFPMWAMSTGNPSFVQGMNLTEQNKNPTFVMHPRLSRFGMDAVSKPIEALDHPTLNGKLEFDFFAGENESRALPRLRHVYGKLSWQTFYILFGQTTDVISPLIPSVNSEAIMWNAGNLGDRQPQIQLGFKPNLSKAVRLELQIAAGQEGARTNADLDGDGNLDGDLSAKPQVQGRLGVVVRHWGEEPLTIGAWTVKGSQRLVLLSSVPQSVSPKTDFNTFAIGADFSIPILSSLKIQGELWQGRNLADLRGGIGQLIDIRTGTEVRSIGGWAELLVKPFSFWRIALGSGTDEPNRDDVQQRGKRTLNRVMWVGNLFTLGSFSVGIDYSRWHTEWQRLNTGLANRFSLSLIFTF
jgi:hypothetical protein